MKKLILPLFALLALSACKKSSELSETPTLEVSKKNMPLIAKYTSQGCGPCGDSGWKKMESTITEYGNQAVYASFYGGLIKTDLLAAFEHSGSTPNWAINFEESGSYTTLISSERTAIADHLAAPVVANANYKMTVSGNKVNLTTTTEFFTDVEGGFYLVPFMLVDGIVAYQTGHDDGANTVHNHWVQKVAEPIGFDANSTGYKVATGSTKAGYKVNLDFETTRDLAWDESDIHFGLVILKEDEEGKLSFVNAFSK